jgi:hypothetical protein
MDGIRDHLPEELRDKFQPVAAELKKGESSFHHARTMHGSHAKQYPGTATCYGHKRISRWRHVQCG